MRRDLTHILTLLQHGQLTAQVAARLPLHEAAHALRLAESGTITGKVVLIPQRLTEPRAQEVAAEPAEPPATA